jgi:glycosyltransferase involved in cell wall biosynthesis
MIAGFPLKKSIKQHIIGECYNVKLIDALAENSDLDITVLANRLNGEKQYTYKSAKIRRLWSPGNLNPFKLFEEIIKLKPDIVHMQYAGVHLGKGIRVINLLLLMSFLRIARYPLLMTIHDIIPLNRVTSTFKNILGDQNLMKRFIYDLGYRLTTTFIGKIASKIIVLDEGTKRWSIEHYGYPKNKIKLIPHGMHDAPIRITPKEAKKALKICEQYNVLLSFGKIHPRKGIEYAIRAMPYVLKKHPNTILLIAGSYERMWEKEGKSYLFSLTKLVKSLEVEDHVLFWIRFFGEEIPIIFSAADIVILPYVMPYGGSGIVKLAATYKKPVITTYSISRKKEIIDGISGVLLLSLDEKILAQRINTLLKDKSLLRRMGERLYEKNIIFSGWEKVARETLECYVSI